VRTTPDIEPASLVADAATRLHRAVVLTGTGRLRPWRTSLSSYAALRVIAARPDLTLAQLSRRCFVRPQTMTRMVRDLEARGWVIRNRKPGDDRAIAISLAAAGRSALEEMDVEARKINATIERALSEAEIEQLNDLLRRCTLEVEAELRTSYPSDAY
jgi:DNA-binding MarR family transcriptional regulator